MSVQRRRSFTDLSISPIQEAGVDDSEDGGCDEFCCADQNHFHHHHHHHHQPTRQSEDSHPSSEVFGTPKSNPQDADKGKGYVLRSVCRSKRLARRKRISRENNSQAGVSSSRGQDENENLNLRNENPKAAKRLRLSPDKPPSEEDTSNKRRNSRQSSKKTSVRRKATRASKNGGSRENTVAGRTARSTASSSGVRNRRSSNPANSLPSSFGVPTIVRRRSSQSVIVTDNPFSAQHHQSADSSEAKSITAQETQKILQQQTAQIRSELETRWEHRFQSEIQTYREKLLQESQVKLREAEERLQAELQSLKKESEQELQLKLGEQRRLLEDASRAELERLTREEAMTAKQLQAAESSLRQRLEAEFRLQTAELQQKHRNEVRELQTQAEAQLKRLRTELQRNQEDLEFQIRGEEKDLAERQLDSVREAESARSRELLSRLQSEHRKQLLEEELIQSGLRETIQRLETDLQRHSARVEDLLQEKRDLESTLTVLREESSMELTDVKQELEALNAELEAKTTEIRNLEQRKGNLEFEVRESERRIRELESELQASQAEVQELRAGMQASEKHFQQEHRKLQSALREAEAEFRSREEELRSEVQKTLQQSSAEKETLTALQERELAKMDRKIQKIRRKTESLKQKRQKDFLAMRKLHNEVQDLKGSVRVFCRVRPPLNATIIGKGNSSSKDVLSNASNGMRVSYLRGKRNGNDYDFQDSLQVKLALDMNDPENNVRETSALTLKCDRVFLAESSQEEIFEPLSELIVSALSGRNVSVLAYGQTSSGKTYTMMGETASPKMKTLGSEAEQAENADALKRRQNSSSSSDARMEDDNDDSDENEESEDENELSVISEDVAIAKRIAEKLPRGAGMIPRAVEQIFAARENLQTFGWNYEFRIGILEIYNEQLNDLLATHRSAPAQPGNPFNPLNSTRKRSRRPSHPRSLSSQPQQQQPSSSSSSSSNTSAAAAGGGGGSQKRLSQRRQSMRRSSNPAVLSGGNRIRRDSLRIGMAKEGNLPPSSSINLTSTQQRGRGRRGSVPNHLQSSSSASKDASSTSAAAANGTELAIRHNDETCQTWVENLGLHPVQNAEEVLELLDEALKHRTVGSTAMNERSSRSHTVFQIYISGKNEKTNEEVQSVLTLVDLAGSERLSKSKATGDTKRETQYINKSLSSLVNSIRAIGEKQKHVNFRDSKLTYLFKHTLGSGSSKALFVVNIAPEAFHYNESLCTLRFAEQLVKCQLRR